MSLSEKLISAAKSGNSREVRKLLGRGALFAKDQFGNTALHEAAWNGNKDIVKALLGGFCFVDSINHSGFTPLHLASQNGHAKVVKILLKWRADPTLLNQHGETALHLAAKYNHPAVVVSFSIFKVPMDIRGKEGNTALHIAAKLGNMEAMKALVHQGADPHSANVQGIRPIDFSEAGNYKDCTKILQTAASKSKPKSSSPGEMHRSSTYSSSATDIAAAKKRMMKAMGVAKGKQREKISTKEKKKQQKRGGYYSEDESLHFRSDDPSPPPLPRPRFSASQELPEKFGYGAMGGLEPSVSPLCNSSSSTSSQQSKSASIDQLLNEIEREYHGPNYSYTPHDKEKGYIKPYAEIHQLHPPDLSSLNHLRASSSNGQPHLLSTHEGRVSRENYDILRPSQENGEFGNADLSLSSYSGRSSNSPPHQLSQDSPPMRRQISNGKVRIDDTDTYVFMAPVADLESDSTTLDSSRSPLMFKSESIESDCNSPHFHSQPCSQLTPPMGMEDLANKNGKKAVICNYPVHMLTRHEPDSSRVPAKGILSQSSVNEMEKSLLEKYLQDELETMRQAFQIRLGQLEKRYKKQLIAEQQRNVARKKHVAQASNNGAEPPVSSSSGDVQRRQPNPHASSHTNSSKRRNSWHSYISSEQELDKLALPDDPRSGSSLGIDSDHYITDDSDIEGEAMLQGEEGSNNNDGSSGVSRGKAGGSNETNSNHSGSKHYFSCSQENNVVGTNNNQHQQLQQNHVYAQPRKVHVEGNWTHHQQHHHHHHNHQHHHGHIYKQPRRYPKEGLKGGDRSWRESSGEMETVGNEPQLPYMNEDLGKDDENMPVDDEDKMLIQKKMDEYREKMMQYFQEKSEVQICNIEERYLKQMDEMKKKYDQRASAKVSHLTNRIKDLENMLDVQTLV